MYLKGKAIILESLGDNEATTGTSNVTLPIPTQVVLKEYKKTTPMYRVNAFLTQRNLFLRDKRTCQYCLRHETQLDRTFEFLTRDHVYPQDKGGKDVWSNVVTACSTCNNKKANKTLEELGWKLPKALTTPTRYELWRMQPLIGKGTIPNK
jgi:5-methylcytosine-specific restriction endonuclease McrA